jgi:DnaJ-domain-containing protein 1
MNYNSQNDNKNYYDLLEVQSNATLQEIHNAYTRARNAYSGDSAALYSLMSQNECEEILNQIEEAYSILGVADKRLAYDKVKGFNQSNTPQGFQDQVMSRPDYMPNNSLGDLISETQNDTNSQDSFQTSTASFEAKQEELKEEYKYNQEHTNKSQVTVSKVQAFKKFGLDYEINPDFELEIENATDYDGELLKRIREYKNVTIERLADMTRISKTYIKNIEADDFTKLPADVYTRGFVYQYAKTLKLNPDLAATSYLNRIRQLKANASE